MEAPKCLLCGTRHWSQQPCPARGGGKLALERLAPKVALVSAVDLVTDGSEQRTPETSPRRRVVAPKGKARSEAAAPSPPPAKKKRGRPATGFDKAAYDREYRRQRRAAQRGKGK